MGRYVNILGLQVKKKGLYKALTWRLQSVTIGFVINYQFIDGLAQVGLATIVQAIVGTTMYLLHEKFWRMVKKKGWMQI